MLSGLDVIKIYDTEINPPNWKRVFCICPAEGLFYRINSHDARPIGVLVPRNPHHTGFLDHDSYIECGKYPLEIDDFKIKKYLESNGGNVMGRVHNMHAQAICDAVQLQSTIDKEVKRLIRRALGC